MKTAHHATDLEVRLMRPEERDAACRVQTRAFHSDFLDGAPLERTLVGVTPDGTISSALVMMPGPLWMGEAQVPAAAIGAVATTPAYQGQGHGAALMMGAVHHLRDCGQWLCPLWPFSYKWYGRLGWGPGNPDMLLRVYPDALRTIDAPSDATRPAEKSDMPAIGRCHDACAKRTNGQTVRSQAWWAERGPKDVSKNGFVYPGPNGEIKGYVFFNIERIKHTQGVQVSVTELQGEDLFVEAALARALAEVPNTTSVHLHLPCSSLLYRMFGDRVPIERLQRLMIRVNDAAQVLAAAKPPAGLRGSLAFEVEDWVVSPDKPIPVSVDIEDGQVAVSGGSRGDAIRCTIWSFSQLYIGALNTAQARALGIIEGGSPDADRLCDGLLFGHSPYRSRLEPG